MASISDGDAYWVSQGTECRMWPNPMGDREGLVPGDGKLVQQAFQRPGGAAEVLRPAEPAEPARLGQVRLERRVAGEARGGQGRQRLAHLAVALPGRHYLAGCRQC